MSSKSTAVQLYSKLYSGRVLQTALKTQTALDEVGCLPDRPLRRIPGERRRPAWAQALGHPIVHHYGGEDASPGAEPPSARTGEEDVSPASHSHPTVHHASSEALQREIAFRAVDTAWQVSSFFFITFNTGPKEAPEPWST